MTKRVRFAPSPTGYIHVGNARTALINWLFAKHVGARFLLRIDDTDQERSEDRYVDAVKEDLSWLGLTWDEFTHQSHRMDRYDMAHEKLRVMGRLYPCYETPEELNLQRKSQLSCGMPPIYNRDALKLTQEQMMAYEAQGRKPHWRFLLDDLPMEWDDLIRGPVKFEGRHSSDPVLYRADGMPVYTITSVIDDIELEISHVIRGEDHVTNTSIQIQLYRALGAPLPTYAHLPLMSDVSGEALSKRLGSLSLRELRAEGILPLALTSYLAKTGSSDPIEARSSLTNLVDEFSFEKYGRATPKFDKDELVQLNTKLLHILPWSEVKEILQARGFTHIEESFWKAVSSNIVVLSDLKDWMDICSDRVTPVITDPDFLHAAATSLPEAPWDESTWGTWMAAVKDQTGRKGKELFMPLRQALTGREDGPELKVLLPLLGRDRVLNRLKGAA